jgi:hypothetical protein
MSSKNIINVNNTPSDVVLAKVFADTSLSMLVKKRFNYGPALCKNKFKELLLLERFFCDKPCWLEAEDEEILRERLIQLSIKNIDEL